MGEQGDSKGYTYKAVWVSPSAEETERLGEGLGRCLGAGDVLALSGDLGGGKTTFTRGVARGLDVPEKVPVQSPTFTLIHEYPGRIPMHHLDLYRLEPGPALEELGMEEYLYPDGVSVIEWAEKLGSEMPEGALRVLFLYLDEGARRIECSGTGARVRRLLDALSRWMPPGSREVSRSGTSGDEEGSR